MKKIALIITLLVCQTISGQQISQSNNHYRGNDVVEKNQRDHGDRFDPACNKRQFISFL